MINTRKSAIIQFLGDPKVSTGIVLLVILARAIQLLFYLDSFFDTSFQVIATQNLVAGHGISTGIVSPEALSTTLYQPVVNWPPGYSLLLAPFYVLFGGDYLPACYLLELLASVAIILIGRRILRQIEVPVYLVNLFSLLTGFFIYYFYYTGSTDSIAIAFYLGGISYLLSAAVSGEQAVRKSLAAAICLLFSAAMKYLFYPIIFVVPVFQYMYANQRRLSQLKKGALISFGILAAGIAGLYFYQHSLSGSGTYISASGRGFFPEHLLRAHPFIPSAFLTPNSIRKLPGHLSIPFMTFLRIFNLIILIGLSAYALKKFLKTGFSKIRLSSFFLYCSLAIGLAISLELAVLSLRVARELIPPDRWWTYVEDARYYGLGDILVHLSVLTAFTHFLKGRSKPVGMIIGFLPLLLLPEALRGFTFTVKRVLQYNKESYYWKTEKDFFLFGQKAAEKRMQEAGTDKLVVTGSLYYGNYRAALHLKAPVMENMHALNDPGHLKTKEPVVLLALIRKELAQDYRAFIEYPGTELAGEREGYYFYTLYVGPR